MTPLKTIQESIGKAIAEDPARPYQLLLSAQHEIGNLSSAYILYERGERGSADHHVGNMAYASGRMVMVLLEFCEHIDIDLSEAIEEQWAKRKLKLWHQNPVGPSPKPENQ